MRAEIAVFVLNLSDIIFLRMAPHGQDKNLFQLFTVLCSVLLDSVIVAICTFFTNDSIREV